MSFDDVTSTHAPAGANIVPAVVVFACEGPTTPLVVADVIFQAGRPLGPAWAHLSLAAAWLDTNHLWCLPMCLLKPTAPRALLAPFVAPLGL